MPYRRADGLRLRPVPELGTCLAFVPHPPRLHTLNPAAWLIAELCDGADAPELERRFRARAGSAISAATAGDQLASGIRQLQDSGVIVWFSSEEDI